MSEPISPPMSAPRTRRRSALTALAATSLVVAAATVAGFGISAAHVDPAAAAAGQDLFISEIHPDNGASADGTTGPTNVDDNYEFFEVTNTTGSAINLAADGIAISYSTSASPATTPKFAVSNGVAGDAVDAGPLDVTIPAHGSTVFWLEYTSSATLNTYARTEADFRAFYDGTVPTGTQIVRVEGQPGIANGGSRTLALIANGAVLNSSFLPERVPTTPGVSTHFEVGPTGSSAAVFLRDGDPTPGTVSDAQLTPPTPSPTPTTSTSPWSPVYPTPVINGTASVGKTLTVDPGTWTPQDTYLTYQWYADEQPIAGATSTSLKLDGKLKGDLITVAVTGWYDGIPTTKTSDPTAPVGGTKGSA